MKTNPRIQALKGWFILTQNERLLVAAILSIALIGLVVKFFYLKKEKPEIFEPEGLPTQLK
jgi:plastocyanin domain-containing protein